MASKRRFCLTEVVGEGSKAKPRSLEVGDKPAVIGRSEQANLSVLVPTVSRRHAEVWLDRAGATIKDLGSGHGTYINGARISKPTVLRQGDLVSLGNDLVFLVSADESSEIDALEEAALAREAPVDSSLVELALSEASDDKRKSYLEALAQLLQDIANATSVDALMKSAVATLAAVMNADRYTAMLGDDADAMKSVARQLMVPGAESLEQPPSRSILRRALVSDKPIITFDAQTDQRFRKRGSIAMSNIRSALCVGLRTAEGTLGVLYADNQVAAGLFSMPDGQFMEMVALAVATRLRQLQTTRALQEQQDKVAELSGAKDSLAGAIAGDVRSHLNRLEMIADDLQYEHEQRESASLLRAEAKRFASDIDHVVSWQARERTRPGDDEAPAPQSPLDDSKVRRSSEVYDDELDHESGSLPEEAPKPELPDSSALKPPNDAPPSPDEEARARKRAEVLAKAANVQPPKRRAFVPTPPPEEQRVLGDNKQQKLTGPMEAAETDPDPKPGALAASDGSTGSTDTPAAEADAPQEDSHSENDLPPAPVRH